jgi:transposase
VAAHGTSVTQIHGVGAVLAAKIVGQTGAVERFPTRHHYASYCAAAPIEGSIVVGPAWCCRYARCQITTVSR